MVTTVSVLWNSILSRAVKEISRRFASNSAGIIVYKAQSKFKIHVFIHILSRLQNNIEQQKIKFQK